MRELRAILASLLLVFGLCGQAGSGSMTLLGVGGPSAAAGLSYTYVGNSATANVPFDGATGTTYSPTLAMGTVPSGQRLILSLATNTASLGAISVVYDPSGANISLTKDVSEVGGSADVEFWSGNVPSGSGTKTFKFTYGASIQFAIFGFHVWLASGLTSGTPQTTATGAAVSYTMTGVVAGNLMFAAAYTAGNAGEDYSGCSPTTPTAVHSDGTASAMADWASANTNSATYTIQAKAAASQFQAAAAYH